MKFSVSRIIKWCNRECARLNYIGVDSKNECGALCNKPLKKEGPTR